MDCQIHDPQSPITTVECGVGLYVTVLERGLGMADCKRREGREETVFFVWVLTIDKMSSSKQRQLFNRSKRSEGECGIPGCLWHNLHFTINTSHSPVFSGISLL
ncbi:hypothetical protein PITC_064120 [Penicillium italicum]|uniref:Uncharacterized protein n=1 Tax=Penicillium italicum TaxID=40296 RepID=A0A0A2KIQ9_PENIT|nr:hypothetical protein PITC_064120 [Penicillium italicum]